MSSSPRTSVDSCCLLTMLTTREGGTAASAQKHAEDDGEASDVGVNDLGDGGAAMRAEAQPAVGGGSRRPRRRWFGFGGWRKTLLKKHDRL